jgi:hypothetical protein
MNAGACGKNTIMDATRPGFALPTTILLLLAMTAGVTAAFARATGEARMVDDQSAQTTAFAVAEAGLERILARGGMPHSDTTLVLLGGLARVRATLVHASVGGDTTLYLLRSDGVVPGGARRPVGTRTVAQYAYHVRARVRVLSTWTSVSGLIKEGASGVISGFDRCSADTIAGSAVPTGTYEYNGSQQGIKLYGENGPVIGNPGVAHMGTTADLAAAMNIDWAAMTDPATQAANTDVIVCYPGTEGYNAGLGPCGTFPARATFTSLTDYFPAILINGSAALPNSGRGTLIVTGDLTLLGGQTWDGLILVGNELTDNGTGAVAGAVVSGLNVLTGGYVDISRANGTKNYTYDSCMVARASERQSRWHQIPNAWADNWGTW